jgi:hypothetical protein
MKDRTNKIILSAIGLGLWANIIIQLIRPTTAIAQYQSDYTLKNIDSHLQAMQGSIDKLLAIAVAQYNVLNSQDNHIQTIDVSIDKLQAGTCSNAKLC